MARPFQRAKALRNFNFFETIKIATPQVLLVFPQRLGEAIHPSARLLLRYPFSEGKKGKREKA